jgi:hypothetical protein
MAKMTKLCSLLPALFFSLALLIAGGGASAGAGREGASGAEDRGETSFLSKGLTKRYESGCLELSLGLSRLAQLPHPES